MVVNRKYTYNSYSVAHDTQCVDGERSTLTKSGWLAALFVAFSFGLV